jgi:DNA-binding protein HU-beta
VTKQEFVDRVASKTGGSRKDAAEAVDAVLDSIQEILTQGGEINFTGFGKFSTQHRKERQGVNPRNPTQKVTIPAATVPKFSAGSTLKSPSGPAAAAHGRRRRRYGRRYSPARTDEVSSRGPRKRFASAWPGLPLASAV